MTSEAHPSIGMAADGRFVIAWYKSTPFGTVGVVPARLFAAAGAPVAGQFAAFTGAMNLNYREPTAAMAPDGRFAIGWTGPDGDSTGIFARRFDATGGAVGDAFGVNDYTTYRQASPAAGLDAAGNLLVAYEGQVGTEQWSYLRQFGPDGAAVGLGEQTGVAPSGTEMQPAVATDGAARVVTAYRARDTGISDGIFVRRFDYAPVAPPPGPGPGTVPTPTPAAEPGATSTAKPGARPDLSRTCGERTKPRSSISRKRRVSTRKRLSLFGRTTDRDCTPDGTDVRAKRPLERIEVSVGTRAKSRKQCQFVQSSGNLSAARSCSKPIYLRARAVKFQNGKATWILSKPVSLKPGSYTAVVRALDREGNTEVAKRRTNRAQFKVR